jgi:hypothetical protein
MTDLILTRDVLADPENAKIDADAYGRLLTARDLAGHATPDNFGDILRYSQRLEPVLDVMIVIDATQRCMELCDTKAFNEWAIRHKSMRL